MRLSKITLVAERVEIENYSSHDKKVVLENVNIIDMFKGMSDDEKNLVIQSLGIETQDLACGECGAEIVI